MLSSLGVWPHSLLFSEKDFFILKHTSALELGRHIVVSQAEGFRYLTIINSKKRLALTEKKKLL